MSNEISRLNFITGTSGAVLEERFLQQEASPEENERVARAVEDHFKSRLLHRFEDAPLIDRNWKTILGQACANIGEESSDPALFLDPQRVRPLSQELDQVILGIEPHGFFPYGNAETVEGEHIRNSMKYLLHNIPLTRQVFNLTTLQMSLMPSDEQKAAILDEIKGLFRNLFALRPENDQVFKTLVGHLIIIYAQLSLSPERDRIEIPQKIEGEWQLVGYELTRIPLNPGWIGEVIYGYGLIPISHIDRASSLLVFKGTDSIFSSFTDMMPGCAVGDLLYWLGKDKIREWIEERRLQFPDQRVQLYGMSLGGALAYNTGVDHFRDVEIHAYAPPGLFSSRFSLPEGEALAGEIFMDPHDLVSLLGQHPVGPQIVKVIRESETSLGLRHARLYGGEGTLLLRANNASENQRYVRTALLFLHQLVSISLFPILLVGLLIKSLWFNCSRLFSLFGSPGNAVALLRE